jgi:hypothetical protein
MLLPAIPQHEQGKKEYQQEDQALIVHQSALVIGEGSGNGIISARMPGVATRNTLGGKPASSASAVLFECLDGIFRAARVKPAISPHQRTDCQPVKAHK